MRANERWLAGMTTRNKLLMFKVEAKLGSVRPAEWWEEWGFILEFLNKSIR